MSTGYVSRREAFCEKYWNKLMRPEGVLAVANEVNSGAEVTICSASRRWYCSRGPISSALS